MKQIKIFAAVIVAAVTMSSCASFSYTSRSESIHRQDINGTSMVVDVRPDFTKRIAAESRRCKTPIEAREEAKYLAITNNKCDVIVDPVYKIEKRSGKYKAYLTGFAGFYENARTLFQDIQMYKDVKKEDIEKYLILKDPSILGVLNQVGNTEIINIYEGKAEKKECCKAACEQAAPAQAPIQESSAAKNKKKK
jgi:hypothetical protein